MPIFLLTQFATFSVCEYHLSVSSSSRPKNVSCSTCVIIVPFSWILMFSGLALHFRLLKTISLVLSAFSRSLFAANQSWIVSSSPFARLAMSLGFLPFRRRFESSANKTILTKSDAWGRSLTYSKKRRGPSTDPWGTPVWFINPFGLFQKLNGVSLRNTAIILEF